MITQAADTINFVWCNKFIDTYPTYISILDTYIYPYLHTLKEKDMEKHYLGHTEW